MDQSLPKFDRKKSFNIFKETANFKLKGSTFDAEHLKKILFENGGSNSFRSFKPRYVSNEDIFHKIPYK